MELNCGLSKSTKRKNKQKWHKWFAWYPVRLEDNDCRWLEYIERKYVYLTSEILAEDRRQIELNINFLCGFIYRETKTLTKEEDRG